MREFRKVWFEEARDRRLKTKKPCGASTGFLKLSSKLIAPERSINNIFRRFKKNSLI